MSEEQIFKQNLHQTFKDTGIVDNMKAQLRHKMITKLKQQIPSQQKPVKEEKNMLRKRIIVSLISIYLEFYDMQYSNSVFLPESGFQNSMLTKAEIFDILQLKEQSILHDSTQTMIDSLIDMFLGKQTKQAIKTNTATQTESGDAIMNLETKLNLVDMQWREKMQKDLLPSQQTVEERMQKWKKEFEERMKADMQAEITRIRQFELANIRLEEAEKSRLEMQDYREELEKKFQDKLNKLRDREKETLDKCQQKMKELESYNHEHRQKIMKDFEMVKMREEELEKSKKLNDERINVEKIRLETLQKDLKNKIRELEDQKLQTEKKLESDKQLAKLEVYKEVQTEQLEYMQKKKVLEEDQMRVNNLKENLDNFKNTNQNLSSENTQLVDRVEELKKKKKELEQDLKQVRDNLQTISESYRREQLNVKNLHEKIKMREEEIDILKHALREKDDISGHHKNIGLEQMKKFNNEIQSYQNQIERLQAEIKNLRQEQIDNGEIIKKGGYGVQDNMFALKHPLEESLQKSVMKQSFFDRFETVKNEHDKIKQSRQQAIQDLMQDNDLFNQKNYNLKFNNVWDLQGSALNISQNMTKQQQSNKQDIINQNQNQNYMDKADFTHSQDYDFKNKNYIEEAALQSQKRDDYNFDNQFSSGQSRGQTIFTPATTEKNPVITKKEKSDSVNNQKKMLSPIREDVVPKQTQQKPSYQQNDFLDFEKEREEIPSSSSKAKGGLLGQLKSMSSQRKDEPVEVTPISPKGQKNKSDFDFPEPKITGKTSDLKQQQKKQPKYDEYDILNDEDFETFGQQKYEDDPKDFKKQQNYQDQQFGKKETFDSFSNNKKGDFDPFGKGKKDTKEEPKKDLFNKQTGFQSKLPQTQQPEPIKPYQKDLPQQTTTNQKFPPKIDKSHSPIIQNKSQSKSKNQDDEEYMEELFEDIEVFDEDM